MHPDSDNDSRCIPFLFSHFFQQIFSRACLKKAFRELRVPICGRFYPNEGKIYRKVGLADCGNDFSDTL